MRLTKRQLKRLIREEYSRLKRRGSIREGLLTESGKFGDKQFSIWSHIKFLANRVGRGSARDEVAVTKGMEYIANTAGYVMEYAVEEHPDPEINERDAQDYAVEFIMGYARSNRKKSMKSYCFAFIDGLYEFLSMDPTTPAESQYFKQVFRILRKDGVI